MSYLKLISNGIKRLRKEQGLTQEEFAEIINMSVQGLRNIEQSKYQPTSATIDLICTAFNISPFDLLLPEVSPSKTIAITDIVKKLKLCDAKQIVLVSGIIDLIRENK